MKKFLVLFIALIIAVPLYGKNTISASATPMKISAGGESKITVYCMDEKGYVIKGVKVRFTVIAGGGKVSPASDTSDGSGTVKATLTLGPKPGTNAVKVDADDAVKSVFLSITGEQAPPAEFTVALENPKLNYDKSTFLTVVVKDAKGALFKDAEVKFNPIDLVTVSPMSAKTDANGAVKVTVKAGKKAGASKIEVAAANLDIKSLDIEVIAPAMSTIGATASSTSIGTRGKTTITVKVYDTSNDPMANIPINFQIDSGDATLSANQSATGANGTCQVELTAGTAAGVVVVKILNKDFAPSEVRINVSASTLPPAFVSAKASEESAIAGDEVTVYATVEDKEKRLVNGANVNFEVTAGGGSVLSKSGTTEDGKASTVFILGSKPGKNTVKVTCNALPAATVTVNAEASGSLSVSEKPGAAEKIFLYTNHRNPSIFSTPMVSAIVTDANNIPVPDVEVKFAAASNIKLAQESVKTDANGEAVTGVSYTGLGSAKVSAAVKGKDDTITLVYGIPEWVYVFPSLVLFLIVFFVYTMKKGSLKNKLVDAGSGLNSDLYLKYKIDYLLERKKNFAACFLDVDEFKNYNTIAGYERGEKVIKELAAIVKKNVPATGTGAHLGGDDFAFICEPKSAKAVSDRIMAAFNEKLATYYNETDFANGYTAIRNSDGMMFNYPLMRLSTAIVEPEKVSAKSYNELLDAAGRLLKSAKAKKDGKIIDEFDDDSERGSRKVKVGWFTVGLFLLALLPVNTDAAVDVSKKIVVSSSPESTGAGQTVKIKARLTDNRERPISGAYILFEDQNKSDGKGSFSSGFAITDKDGNAEVAYTVGSRFGKSMVKASWKGDKVLSSVFITVRVNYMRYLFILIGLIFLGFTVLNFIKFIRLNPLFNGIDTETGMKTRLFAEAKIKKLITENAKFNVIFMDYRNFAGFNREYGYEGGNKAAKTLGDQMKSLIKEFAPKDAFPYSYGEDKFVIIAKQKGEEIVKNLIEEMEIHIPLLCEDKNANYYLLHLSVALVDVDPAKTKSIGEIMQIAGRLLVDAKTKPGSAYAKG